MSVQKVVLVLALLVLQYAEFSTAQSYEDRRCKCICPSIRSVLNNTNEKTNQLLMIDANVPPNKCDCDSVILPRVGDKIKGKEQEFCPRCECKYEIRNTTVIQVVVIIVIWIISLLCVYMLFLMCLDPLLNKRAKANYQEQIDDDAGSGEGGSGSHQMVNVGASRSISNNNVLNRVSNQQDKWKRQVLEQRRNIYDRHTMLN